MSNLPHLLNQTLRQRINILNIQRVRRLVQRQYPAVLTE